MPTKCIRLTTSGEKSFERVELLTYDEQVHLGIRQIFGDNPRNRTNHDQIAWRTHEGIFICDAEDIMLIHLDKENKVNKNCPTWAKRIAIGDMTYENINIFAELHEGLAAGFPNLLGEDQVSLHTTEGRFISHDGNCVIVQVR